MPTINLSVKLPENCYQMLELMAREQNSSVTMVLIDLIQQTYMLHHNSIPPQERTPQSGTDLKDAALLSLLSHRLPRTDTIGLATDAQNLFGKQLLSEPVS